MIIELSVVSADTKRKELEAYQAKKEAERIAYEAQRNQRVERLVECLFNKAKSAIENTIDCSFCSIDIYENDLVDAGNFSMDELVDAADIVFTLLHKAGYTTNGALYKYSRSWRDRSGKVAYFSVRW